MAPVLFGDRMIFIVLALILLFTPSYAKGEVAPDLAYHSTWLKLGKYEEKSVLSTRFQSAVLSERFFLSPIGRNSPTSELQATLDAMMQPVAADPNDHAQCRFPARYLWLRKRGLLRDATEADCSNFKNWMLSESTESISIIFATGYLSNPASYYGHTLLKFNSPIARANADLLDISINYGAIVPPNTGPLSYIFHGATGGFNAGFSSIEYYYHDFNYGELELRDLWEYELNLSKSDVNFILAHAWEVLGQEFVYYFFRRNCAYRMAELIEIIEGVEIIPQRRPWTVPQSLISKAKKQTYRESSLIKRVIWHPSRQSIFRDSYKQLEKSEREILSLLISNPGDIERLQILPVDRRIRILDVAINYYGSIFTSTESIDPDLNRKYNNLLALRLDLPSRQPYEPPQPRRDPGDDRSPGYVSTGYFETTNSVSGVSLRLRPAYYDNLDFSVSHVPYSELSMGEVVVDIVPEALRLRQATIFRVEAANRSVSGLPGDTGNSWRLGVGAYQQFPDCDRCTVARFEGDVARIVSLRDNLLLGLYLGGVLQNNLNEQGTTFVRVGAQLGARVNTKITMQAKYEYWHSLDSARNQQQYLSVAARYEFAKNWDVRFAMQASRGRASTFSIGRYW